MNNNTRPYIKIENDIANSILDITPMPVVFLNDEAEILYFNEYALSLFEIDDKKDSYYNISSISPQCQVNGESSAQLYSLKMKEALENKSIEFDWLHYSMNEEKLPCRAKLVAIDSKDEFGNQVFAYFLHHIESAHNLPADNTRNEERIIDKISDKQLFDTIAQLSDELIFIFDIKNKEVQFQGKGMADFSLSNLQAFDPEMIVEIGRVYSEDTNLFIELCNNILNGIIKPIDIRLVQQSGLVRYYRINYQIIFDDENNSHFAIGKAFDINEQKSYEMRSKTDLLTNCYNKVTSENIIVETINNEPSGVHALFIVDIDNFKAINDNLGHHFGDLVLSDVASNLRSHFRTNDIIGRIGGDEFIVFLQNVTNNKIIESKAKSIAKAFQNSYSGENGDYKISGSIGISSFPKDGETFEELYKAADKALYQSKLSGKDRYTFYNESFLDGTMKNRTKLENADRIANSYFDSELVSTVFNLMYETKELSSSINTVLKYIGKRTNSDRCYIFESFNNGKTYSNTYEWVEENITPEIDNLQNLTAEILDDFLNTADKNGTVFSNDLSVLEADGAYKLMYDQGIKSFLHAQVREKDTVQLFLGLDDCTKTRIWSEKEINSLVYAAKMISIFLLKNKTNEG